MVRLRYEPFGERLAPQGDARPRSRASRYLLWAGTGLFWSLVGAGAFLFLIAPLINKLMHGVK